MPITNLAYLRAISFVIHILSHVIEEVMNTTTYIQSGEKSRGTVTLNEEITTCSTQKSDHEIKKLWKKLIWGLR